jgi:tetratricopeptide (TPR) repeat protein
MRPAVMVFLVLVMAATAVAAEPAIPGDRAKARELYRRATQHYNLAEYQQALEAFKEGYRNFEDPIFLFNIGQCERQLDHKVEAVRFYRAYLRNKPDAPNRNEVNALITRLDSAIAEDQAARRMPPPSPAPGEGPLFTPPATGTTAPAPATSAPAVATSAGTNDRADKPLYKKWWLWAIVGGVAAGAAVGLGVGLGTSKPSTPSTTTDLGNYRF